MKGRRFKNLLAVACLLTFAGSAAAQPVDPTQTPADKPRTVFFPSRGAERESTNPGHHLLAVVTNLIDHGGPKIFSAKVVLIFWGPSFNNPSSPDYTYAQTIIKFRNQFGSTSEYKTITEYGIQSVNLKSGTADWFDTSTPPANVTDANVQSEVNRYLASHTFDANTIYEVFIPSTSYSSNGSVTSCGGPTLRYCAYHSWIGSGSSAKKYSIQPYPSCSGCQYQGWTAVQNQEHFVTHETREAATDPTGTGWYDSNGAEADDKCAWSPPPFIGTGGYGYQFEWSNTAGACIASTSPGSVPGAPTLSLEPGCYGRYDVSWTAPAGATSYELWSSYTSTFDPQTVGLLYSGPGTSFAVVVGSTLFIHVRACNASGCSAFSNSRILTYSTKICNA
jgi:hypothetical protein